MKQLDIVTIVALCLNGILGLILTGFSTYFDADLDRSHFLLNLSALITLGWWIVTDAARRKVPLGLGSAVAAIMFFPVFFAYYCFRSRGGRGWLLCVGSAGALVVYLLLQLVVILLVSAVA